MMMKQISYQKPIRLKINDVRILNNNYFKSEVHAATQGRWDMAIDESTVNDFKERELEIDNSYDVIDKCCAYNDLADEIHGEGESDWAIKLYIKAFEHVEYAREWWDDFDYIVDLEKLDKKTLKRLFEKWEINVKENRGNLGYMEKEELYHGLLYVLEKHISDEEWIDKIKTERANSYTIEDLKDRLALVEREMEKLFIDQKKLYTS